MSGIPRVLGYASESKDSDREPAASGDEISQERLEVELPNSMVETQSVPQGGAQIKCRPGLQEILR